MFGPKDNKKGVVNDALGTPEVLANKNRVNDELLKLENVVSDLQSMITSPTSGIAGILTQVADQIGPKGIIIALGNLDQEASKLVKTFGISKERAGELTQTVADAIPKFVEMGLEVGDVQNTCIYR